MSDAPDELNGDENVEEPAKPEKKVKASKPPKQNKEKSKGFNWVMVLVPVAFVAALILAYTLPPSHAMLLHSPLKPLLARFEHPSAKGVAATAQKPADPQADVKRLSEAVESDRKAALAKDAQIAQLQSQVTDLQAKPTPAPTPAGGKATPAAVSDAVKRTATVWTGMDADKAADVVKQLPDAYVKLVFSQMPADAVADIVSALPAKTAARLTGDAAASDAVSNP